MNEFSLIYVVIALQCLILLILFFRKGSKIESLLVDRFDDVEKGLTRIERIQREEETQSRLQQSEESRLHREELSGTLKMVSDSLTKTLTEISSQQMLRLGTLTESNENKLELLKLSIDKRLESLQVSNEQKLEQMRVTVDEKLQGTLEKRLGESFKQVSDRLEQVHKGLGEMQTLATGVGDLKKVLTNVKTKGVWGEVLLRALIEEILTPAQYECNVKTNPATNDLVEFAVRLPGNGDEVVWLPLDSKFPTEDYQRLVEAQDTGDVAGVELAGKQLETRVKLCAKDIQNKYISPPNTTDFGIMFLPSEGLYAEVARRQGLLETIQRDHRVVVAGPATFSAFLNSLQMGFRTLAIEKRSSEVWKVLGQVKSEFGKFGDVLDGVKKKLVEATNTMDRAASRSRTIERRLREVESLPSADEAEIDVDATLLTATPILDS